MKRKLHILLVEDDSRDAALIAQPLDAPDFDVSVKCVQTETEFRHELESARPDVVLLDHGLNSVRQLPAFNPARQAPDHP